MSRRATTRSSAVLLRFGTQVRKVRISRGFSQEKLGEIAGLDRTYVSGIERGLRNVSLRNIAVLARALGVTASDLLVGV
jgi:transcriptional regulator with XRE-family HTH domain